MKNKKSKSNFFTICLLVFIIGILIPVSEGFSQNLLSINENVGGGSSGTQQQDTKSDNATLYVVGGLLIGGIIAYALFKNKDEKKDTSDAKSKSAGLILNNNFESLSSKILKAKDEIPVNIILGIRNESAFISEETYLFGVSVRF